MENKTQQLPEEFVAEMRQLLGEERWQRYASALEEERPVSIRLNPAKTAQDGCSGVAVPWCRGAYWLKSRPQFTFDPLLHAGCYYVQEAGSMVVDSVVRNLSLTKPMTCLDMCAAPGGKSTVLCAALPEGSTVVSNEPLRPRAQVLAENISKWGCEGSVVTNNYPKDFARAGLQFDLILVDAPCSGEGMFRKEADAISTWSRQKVAECATLQREILSEAWRCLRPGGTLIYSTCTYNIHEDEEQLIWMTNELGASPLSLSAIANGDAQLWGCLGSLLSEHEELPVMRFMPGFTDSEGLFVCAVRKDGDGKATDRERLMQTLKKRMKVMENPLMSEAPVATCDVDYATALAYLRGEAIVLPPDIPRGMVGITYRGQMMGMAKNIGNRANNLYPKPWRIKSTHLPAEAPQVLSQR